MRNGSFVCFAAALVSAISAAAQGSPKPLSFVMPHGDGRVVLAHGADWVAENIGVLDQGSRPIVTFKNNQNHLIASYVLFPNTTGKPTPESCRDAVLDAALHPLGAAVVRNKSRGSTKTDKGVPLATGFYFVEQWMEAPVHDGDLFGVYGDEHLCAEVHVSKVGYTEADRPLLEAVLKDFQIEPAYKPQVQDKAVLGAILFRTSKDYAGAAYYYRAALDALPESDAARDTRRYLVDQLSMAYGISGKLKESRAVNDAAIQHDPEYPLYYYNLACADAEQGDAKAAQTHLQAAFDRRANTLQGEALPDPATDDSIQKLKKNKQFWAFVEGLSTQIKQGAKL